MTSDQLEPGTLSAVQLSCGELYAPKLHLADVRWDGTVSVLVASSGGVSYKELRATLFLTAERGEIHVALSDANLRDSVVAVGPL